MFVLAHLSDIHLSPLPMAQARELMGKRTLGYLSWQWERAKKHNRGVLDQLVADMKQQSYDHIAVTGDLVNLSLPAEFAEARRWLETVGDASNVSVVPGNHDAYVPVPDDIGMMRWQPYMQGNEAGAAYKVDRSSPFPYVRLFGRIAIVGLSTANPTPWFVHAGKLGVKQSAEMETILHRLGEDGYFRVLLIHHPPVKLPRVKQLQLGLHDVTPFRRIVERTGAELILHGHHHINTRLSMPSSAGPVPIIGVPSASVSRHPRKPLARYNLYEIFKSEQGWQCRMTGRGLTRSGGEVEQIEQTSIIGEPAAAAAE